MHGVKDPKKTGKRKMIGVMLLVSLMLAGSYIATMRQTQDVSALLPVERVPIPEPELPEATTGSAGAAPPEAPEADAPSGFLEYRNTLSGTRSAAAALLDEVIADASASAETVRQAIARKAELADAMAMEAEMETLLQAGGFSEVLCTVGPQAVNIVVQCDGLTQQQASQIMDIAISVTGQPASHIRIIPSE